MQNGRSSSLMEGIETASTVSKRTSSSGGRSWDAKTIAMAIGGGVVFLVAAVLIFRAVGSFTSSAGADSRRRTAVDSVSGEVFKEYAIKDGDTWPWKNPKTGDRTLYPAETCFWTKDGQATLEPTHVILNEVLGIEGATICPDCGRQVVTHNPMPPTELLVKAGERKAADNR